MRSTIRNHIGPPEVNRSQTFSDAKVGSEGDATKDSTQFVDLLQNSNQIARQERSMKDKGDLSGAKNDQELFNMLNDQTKNQRVPKNKLDKDDFLKLFVTQLQNQDPLNPKDNTEMAAQLAQFNGLEQMLNVNKNLEKMSAEQAEGKAVNLLTLMGKEITVDGGELALKGGQANEAMFEVENNISTSKIEVVNEDGDVVFDKALGRLEPGDHSFRWDGMLKSGERAPDGKYTYSLKASNEQGTEIDVPISSKVLVEGINLSGGAKPLKTAMGDFAFGDVKALEMAGSGMAAGTKPTELAAQVQSQARLKQPLTQQAPAAPMTSPEQVAVSEKAAEQIPVNPPMPAARPPRIDPNQIANPATMNPMPRPARNPTPATPAAAASAPSIPDAQRKPTSSVSTPSDDGPVPVGR